MDGSREAGESEARVAVESSVWADAGAEARARDARASTVRWATWMAFIGVSLVAMAATFVGLPLELAFSVLLLACAVVWVVLSVGAPRLLPDAAPALDRIRREVSRAWDVALTRDDVSRLVTLGGTVAAATRITSTEGPETVQLDHEVLEVEGGSLWQYGLGSPGPG